MLSAMMFRMKVVFGLLVSVLLLGRAYAEPTRPKLTYRWFYVGSSLSDRAAVDRITGGIFPRAAKAGYNGVMVGNIAFGRSPEHIANVRRFREAAAQYHLDIIPWVMMHNLGTVLDRDPNLAEGLPVREALFVVQGREATLHPDPPVHVANGGFEEASGDRFGSWEKDSPGQSAYTDHAVFHSGGASLRVEGAEKADPRYGQGRLMQRIKVRPFRQYHLRFWVKTQDFGGRASCEVLASAKGEHPLADLADHEPGIEVTQDWTRYDLLFNSLEWNEVRLYLGVWSGKGGRIWWDDVSLEEVGLLNPLRRAGTPITVRGEDGARYEEGRDYEPVRDAALAANPSYHAPLSIRLTANSHIQDGQLLRVSYYHPIHLANNLASCLSEPKVYDIMRQELVFVNDMLHPRIFFMSDDEIRVANWDESCQQRHLTPGQLLADKVRRCTKMIEELRPDAEIWDWSDMFDPVHNAVADYYAVNGSWAGSWEGLAPEVGIVNWANHLQGRNLKFFADRGHKQILAGFYDGDGYPIDKWLAAGAGLPGIVGVMYTTWQDDYSQLEAFAQQAWGDPQ
jgi:hypothetical protein